ncbi:hypothetical protein Tco_1420364 [Tanacetum coccineum]
MEEWKNAFSGTNGEDAVGHTENFLEVIDLIKVPKLNNGIPWVEEKPWTSNEEWAEPMSDIRHQWKPLRFKIRTAKWTSCNWKKDGYNIGDLPGLIREGNLIHYESYEWYDMIEDSQLKEEALNNKKVLEKSMNKKEESSDDERSLDSPIDEWEDYEHDNMEADVNSNYNPYLDISWVFNDHRRRREDEIVQDEMDLNNDKGDDMRHLDDHLVHENEPFIINVKEEGFNEQKCKPLGTLFTRPLGCKTEGFEVFKYSFGPLEKYIAIKECGYYDWTTTKENACHAYQDIFHKMDEGWFVTRME